MNRETAIGRTQPGPVKASRVELQPRMTLAQGFETIVNSCVRHFRLNEALVIQHRSADGLHQVRVALRRLRSAFSLFKPVIADREFKRLDDELSGLSAVTGEARNLDAYLERDLSDEERGPLQVRREEAYDTAIVAMNSAHVRRLMVEIVTWAADGEWRVHDKAQGRLARFMNRRIDKLWKKTHDARRVAKMGALQRHHLRIRVKKLRYALDFARGLHQRHKKRRKAFERALKALQEALGQLNDAVVARRLSTGPASSSTVAPQPDEGGLVKDAEAALERLRETGAYW